MEVLVHVALGITNFAMAGTDMTLGSTGQMGVSCVPLKRVLMTVLPLHLGTSALTPLSTFSQLLETGKK